MFQIMSKTLRWSVALTLALALALLITLNAQAQDEPPPPEAPALPAVVPTTIDQTTQAEGEPQAPAATPLVANELPLYSGPDPWFYCSGAEPTGDPFPGNGKCEYVGAGTLTTAINEFAFRGGSGLITCENGAYTASPFINGIPLLTGIVSANGSGVTSINGRVEITNQTAGFILRGFAIGVATDSSFPLLYFHENSGTIKLTDIILNDNLSGPGLRIENHTGSVLLERVQVDNNRAIATLNYIASIIANGNITINNGSFDNNGDITIDSGTTLYIESQTGKVSLNGVSVSNNTVGDGIAMQAATGITVKNSQINYNQDGLAANAYGYGIYVFDNTRGSLLFENVTANYNQEWAVRVKDQGVITLRNFTAEWNARGGVNVDNCYFDGAICNPGGAFNVSIFNSYLNENGGTGLMISSNGSVLLDGVRSLDSGTAGANIYNHFAASAKPVTILRSQFMDTDNGTGLLILTRGSVQLNNVFASGNLGTGSGAIIDNSYSASAGVSLLSTYGSNDFSFNTSGGLVFITNGSISLKNVSASSNVNDGVSMLLGNPRNVTIDGFYALFNGSGGSGSGLLLTNTGTISLKNFSLIANYDAGAGLNNLGASAASYPGVTLVNGTIINNTTGLDVDTRGAISLTNVNSYGNTGALGGADLDNCQGMPCIGKGGVTVKDSQFFSNTTGAAGGPGLKIQSGGAINLTNVTGNDNYNAGVYAHNNNAVGSPGITIRNGTFSGSLNSYGADLLTKGAISLTNITASDNHLYGLYAWGQGRKSITMSVAAGGRNTFSDNGNTGLALYTEGSISVRGITSSNPTTTGIVLNNAFGTGTAGITLRDVDAHGNDGIGIIVSTHGTIIAAGLVAYNNDTAGASNYYAVYLDNCDYDGTVCTYAGPVRNVNLTAYGSINNSISSNAKSGLGIFTLGAVTIRDAWVYGNLGTDRPGTFLYSAGANGTITVHKSQFTNNGHTGLRISTNGSVSLSDIEAHDNDTSATSSGISINSDRNVSLTNIDTRANRYSNINISCAGTVILRSVVADSSVTSAGIAIENTAPPAGNNVILNKVTATGNDQDNIHVVSNGAISGSGITCDGSVSGYGCFFQNTDGVAGITLSTSYGVNNANGNALDGLWLDTFGAITLTGVTASGNHAVGIHNGPGIAPAAGQIKLTNVRVEGNWNDGIAISSNTTPIRITNSIVMGNTLIGINATFIGGIDNQLILKNTLFFGNDRIDAGNPNINVTNGIVVIQ
ncbi:MAG: hypothetical protein HPY76_02840 [Anaerolineae bacterium]|nr:hypothetical protein [Anaerolineae bacterium]